MQQTKSARAQNLRRIATIIGFTFFVFFIYKAGHEVSNPKIAAGAQHTQVVNANTDAVFGIQSTPGYSPTATLVSAPVTHQPVASQVAPSQKSEDPHSAKQVDTKDMVKVVKDKSTSQSGQSAD